MGILAIELANGIPPYVAKHKKGALEKIVKRAPPKVNKKWSIEFQDFVSRCLIKIPMKRTSIDELLKHGFLADADQHKEEHAALIVKVK